MFREKFIEVQESRRITGKAISEISGVSTNHIAQFRKGNRDVTSETLWQLIQAMEKISPGAKLEFCQRLAGEDFFSEIGNEQLSKILFAIARILEQRRLSPQKTREKVTF